MGLDHDANNSSSLELGLGLSLTTTTTSEETTTIPPPSSKPVDDNNNNNNLCIKPTPMKPICSSNFITGSSNAESEAEPSLTLGLSGDSYRQQQVIVAVPKNKTTMDTAIIGNNNNNKVAVYCEDPVVEVSRQTSPHSVVSSFSSGRVVVKRERPDVSCEEYAEIEAAERVSSRASDEDEDAINARKKLRLTKEQSALLEESFKQHSTLNPKQKQALARQLNLRPRQVEVWFQNRRARTKLKQTEVDCEFLKKCCETLTDENRRLKKELQELKALKLSQPLYMPMPAATLTMCPSCERLNDTTPNKSPFSIAMPPTKTHFYNPFTNPSAAC